MNAPLRVLLISVTVVALAGLIAACGSQKLNVPEQPANVHHGAVLFSQRCAGCHTLSYAATRGSATNVRSREITDGPNFNVRCERPIDRVLYAIVNGGFSGAIMPQNVVTGQDARDVAEFVATYAGRAAPKIVGQTACVNTAIGARPAPGQSTASSTDTGTTSSTVPTPAATTKSTTTTTSTASKKKK
jgi:mono/diheme cytochrome c family protein